MKSLKDIKLRKKDRESIETAVRLLNKKFPVEEVILFGSKARGHDDPESDIDLLVLTSHALDWRERDRLTDSLFDIELAFDVVISTLVVSKKEWDKGVWRVLPIRTEIEKDGVAA